MTDPKSHPAYWPTYGAAFAQMMISHTLRASATDAKMRRTIHGAARDLATIAAVRCIDEEANGGPRE